MDSQFLYEQSKELKKIELTRHMKNKYPRVQQMRPRAHFRLLNTFFDFKKNKLFLEKNIFILKNS